jgi:HK97 gp10 family phage protein
MVTRTRTELKGLRELGAAMRALGNDMGLKIARSATNAAAQPVKKRAKAIIRSNPSIETGSLLDSVIVKRLGKGDSKLTSEHIVTVRGRGKVSKKTGRRQSEAPYASKVEFGTVNMPAEPFLRPGFEQSKGEALNAMVGKLKQRIDKANR